MDLCARSESLRWSLKSQHRFQACGETTSQLPAGAYSCDVDHCGEPLLSRRALKSDHLITAVGSVGDEIINEVNQFWGMGERFHRYGFLHRRGYLFYGKQGGGKSSVIHQIVSDVVARGNVAFFCSHPHSFIRCLTLFRKIEPDRPLVCVFEDIESIIEDFGDNVLLQWLDGNHQVDCSVNLASTNYPEQLDRRIIARPRRFDRVLRIDSPCEKLRNAFLETKLPEQSAEERQTWVKDTDGFTFASLSELIISVRCLDIPYDDALVRLRSLDSHEPSSSEFNDHEELSSGRKRRRCR